MPRIRSIGSGGSGAESRWRWAETPQPAARSANASPARPRALRGDPRRRTSTRGGELSLEDSRDARGGEPVAERVLAVAHPRVELVVGQERRGLLDDPLLLDADQPPEAGLDQLRPLGCVTQHEHGLAKRRRLLLDAA